MASAPALALEAEILEEVALQLRESWASSCVTIPLGNHQYAAEAPAASGAEQAGLSFDRAVDLGGWDKIDAVTVTFSDYLGNPTPEPSVDGGAVLVELVAADDPLIEVAPDTRSACFALQGSFADIRPTSIIPVTLDDGRPGRVYFFDYTANWSPAVAQRYQMGSERVAAVLVSFDPGTGWNRIESLSTEEAGLSFPPDSFSSDGLARFDIEHEDRIEIVEVPENYQADLPLAVRYGTVFPADVAACRGGEPWEQPDCLGAVAQSGAILGALSRCARDDTGCLTDLFHAEAPDTIADWCLPQQGDDGSKLPRCQAFAALTGTQDQPAAALPHWRSPRLIRRDEPGGAAFFIRAHSLEYGPLAEFEISERERSDGTPYLKITCGAGQLGAAMLYAAHSPLWAAGEPVSANVKGRWDEEHDTAFVLVADRDGSTLAFDDGDIARFFGNALRGESFDLTTSGDAAMRAHFSIRRIVSAFGDDIDLPALLSEAGCGAAVGEAGL
ncbi:hypothetical protein O9Z70_13285 [Devosia sp. YIM 151766]|uniref:hypothetical protein n=1 Tax=Devosia sp. YIM 151766 TaxID=3017325 RepID=UPI00255C391D|nr:hypothetical protein [Devosia sp. YIM 151766]WIY52423.1 hypothetical protein O9Z70_13285 [Devosia sp. YIM 151766]